MSKWLLSVLITIGYPFIAEAHQITAPSDFIVGGISDGTNFIVGDVGSSTGDNEWPSIERPSNLIDGSGNKYLNFAGDTSPSGAITTPGSGTSVVSSITFWTANDVEGRDPASYELYGTNSSVSALNPGDTIPLTSFTLISSGAISLPTTRDSGGDIELNSPNSLTVPLVNTTSFLSYLILFPTIKDKDGFEVNSMQIAEIQLAEPDADNISLTGVGQTITNGDGDTSSTDNTDFGSEPINDNSKSHVFTITNNSGSDKVVNSISIEETGSTSRSFSDWLHHFSWWQVIGINDAVAVGASDFTVVTVTPFTIANGSSETFTINFTPTAAGLRDGIVVVTFSDGSTFRFTISGNGTVATLTGNNSPQNVPVFGPLGLLAMLVGLLWFGNRRRNL